MNLVEVYLLYPDDGPLALARRTGMTLAEVIEVLIAKGLPLAPRFYQELRVDQRKRGGSDLDEP